MALQSVDELKALLEKHERGKEILDFVTASIEAEKSRGEQEKSSANNEARKRREQVKKFRAALQKVGYEEGADVEEFIEALSERIGSANSGTTPSGDDSELKNELAKLRRDFEKNRKELDKERLTSQEIRSKAAQRTIRSKLSDALRDKVYGHDLLADSLIAQGKVRLDEDEESVVFVEGENAVSFDDGVKSLLKARTDILKNTQTPGSRTSAASQRASGGKYSRAQLESMSQAEMLTDMPAVRESWNSIRAAEAATG